MGLALSPRVYALGNIRPLDQASGLHHFQSDQPVERGERGLLYELVSRFFCTELFLVCLYYWKYLISQVFEARCRLSVIAVFGYAALFERSGYDFSRVSRICIIVFSRSAISVLQLSF